MCLGVCRPLRLQPAIALEGGQHQAPVDPLGRDADFDGVRFHQTQGRIRLFLQVNGESLRIVGGSPSPKRAKTARMTAPSKRAAEHGPFRATESPRDFGSSVIRAKSPPGRAIARPVADRTVEGE